MQRRVEHRRSPSASAVDVSVIVTNYNTGPYLARCLDSIFAQELGGLDLEVIVVENASFLDQEPYLAHADKRGAKILRLTENYGHGGGCNRGFRASRGRYVFLLNSDTVACEGALAALVRYLDSHPEAGIIEPRTYLDDARAFLIPEIFAPSPWDYAVNALSSFSSRFAARISLRHLRRRIGSWRTSRPIEQDHLTGAFLAARRDVLVELGGYDEGYPLYYEDSDLFARTRRSGWKLVLVPAAEVVHYGHRSVATIWDEAMAKSRVGRERYMRCHCSPLARWCDVGSRALLRLATLVRTARGMRHVELGTLDDPPDLGLTRGRHERLFELALDPFFLLSAARFDTAEHHPISRATWESLFPTTYYLRAIDLESWTPLGTWSFEKA